jgi:hypothetical protein
MNDHDDTDNEPIGYDRKAEEREAHGDFLRDEMIDREMEERREERMKKPAETPTPITDSAPSLRLPESENPKVRLTDVEEWVDIKVARYLERQLAEARDTIEHLKMENGLIEFYQMKDQLAEAREHLEAERALADRLGNEIERLSLNSSLVAAIFNDVLTAWKEARKA